MAGELALFDTLSDPRALASTGVGGVVLYKIWRWLRDDRRSDARAGQSDRFYDDLVKQAAVDRARADAFAIERNKAVSDFARLSSELEVLRERMAESRTLADTLTRQLGELREELSEITIENASLKARIEILNITVVRAGSPDPVRTLTPHGAPPAVIPLPAPPEAWGEPAV